MLRTAHLARFSRTLTSVSRAAPSVRHSSSIKSLYAQFQDPASPFHIAPGTRGPAHEEDHGFDDVDGVDAGAAEEARRELMRLGYDPTSFWEQHIVWGDHDSFQHVNNVRYLRFFESGRIKWMMSLGREIGGAEKAEAMMKGRGVSLILKSVSINYKRPVTYPDTLLIAHRPHAGPMGSAAHTETGPRDTQVDPGRAARRLARTHFHCMAVAWSYKQRRIVTESDSVLVWYDYDKLAKCSPGEEVLQVLERRMNLGRETLQAIEGTS
ncbi:acyl-CoA thioesterase [Phanerochaete sordida]|uniref:Acyl-CoA thioesterase n=1 Tax=Phanerochaete sordida TaxID=48140 RepID=A0A9P3GPQ6_9APHY|nr:acyl-CoA thioesterase [Phanerochaete sordida]